VSGGSHNYLHSRAPDTMRELANELHDMAESIRAMGYRVCADKTEAMAEQLRDLENDANKMADLWHDVEWYDSGDWGKGPARAEAIKRGEPLPPCPHTTTHRAYGFPGGDGPNARVDGSFDYCDECGEALNFAASPPKGRK
jgi:hypothetical protein